MPLPIEKKIDYDPTSAGQHYADEINTVTDTFDEVIITYGDQDPTSKKNQLVAALAGMQSDTVYRGTIDTSVTPNEITLTSLNSKYLKSYVSVGKLLFTVDKDNTGPVKIGIESLEKRDLKDSDGNDLIPGAIKADTLYIADLAGGAIDSTLIEAGGSGSEPRLLKTPYLTPMGASNPSTRDDGSPLEDGDFYLTNFGKNLVIYDKRSNPPKWRLNGQEEGEFIGGKYENFRNQPYSGNKGDILEDVRSGLLWEYDGTKWQLYIKHRGVIEDIRVGLFKQDDDFDNYKDDGIYVVDDIRKLNNATHKPVDHAGSLTVRTVSNFTGSPHTLQIYRATDGRIYTRYDGETPGSFTRWRYFYNSYDPIMIFKGEEKNWYGRLGFLDNEEDAGLYYLNKFKDYNDLPSQLENLDEYGTLKVEYYDKFKSQTIHSATNGTYRRWGNPTGGFGDWERIDVSIIDENITVYVGSCTDAKFTTLNEAIEYYRYKVIKSGVIVTLKLCSGYIWKEPLVITENERLGFIAVESEDAEVTVSSDDIGNNPIISVGRRAKAITLKTTLTVDKDDTGKSKQHGVVVYGDMQIINGGIKNSNADGIRLYGNGYLYIKSSVVTDSFRDSLKLLDSSKVIAYDVDFSNSNNNAILCSGNINLYARRCKLNSAKYEGLAVGSGSSNIFIQESEIKFNGSKGVYLNYYWGDNGDEREGIHNLVFDDTTFEDNKGPAIRNEDFANITVKKCKIISNILSYGSNTIFINSGYLKLNFEYVTVTGSNITTGFRNTGYLYIQSSSSKLNDARVAIDSEGYLEGIIVNTEFRQTTTGTGNDGLRIVDFANIHFYNCNFDYTDTNSIEGSGSINFHSCSFSDIGQLLIKGVLNIDIVGGGIRSDTTSEAFLIEGNVNVHTETFTVRAEQGYPIVIKDNSSLTLSRCIIKGGEDTITILNNTRVTGKTVTIDGGKSLIVANNGRLSIDDLEIKNTTETPLKIYGGSDVHLPNCNINKGSNTYALEVYDSARVMFKNPVGDDESNMGKNQLSPHGAIIRQ